MDDPLFPDLNNPFVFIGVGALIVLIACISIAWLPVWLGVAVLLTMIGGFAGFMIWAGINGHLD